MSTDLPEFATLTDEVAALRTQVRDYRLQMEHLEAKNQWLTRMVFGVKSERKPVAQQLGAAQQQNFLTTPVTAVASDPAAEQAAAEQQEAQTQATELTKQRCHTTLI